MKRIALGLAAMVYVGCATTISGTLAAKDPKQKIDYQNARINISRLDKANVSAENYVVAVDEEGAFETAVDLEKGRYLVEALVPGFAAESKTLEIQSSQEIHLKVTPLDSPATSSISPNMNVELGKGEGGATLMPPNL